MKPLMVCMSKVNPPSGLLFLSERMYGMSSARESLGGCVLHKIDWSKLYQLHISVSYAYSKILVMIPVPTGLILISPVLLSRHMMLTRFVAFAKRESVNDAKLDPPSDTNIQRRTENQLLQQHPSGANRSSPRCHPA